MVGSTSDIAAVSRSFGIGMDACAMPLVWFRTCQRCLASATIFCESAVTSRRTSRATDDGTCTTTISGPLAPGPSWVAIRSYACCSVEPAGAAASDGNPNLIESSGTARRTTTAVPAVR